MRFRRASWFAVRSSSFGGVARVLVGVLTGQIIDIAAAELPPGPANRFQLAGTALGGSVSIFVEGIEITVATVAGQTAAQVLQALADAVNVHPSLQALGISAQVLGGELVITGGEITGSSVDDPGLDGVMTIDALPP